MRFAKIIGTGSFVPPKILTNADLAQMVDTDDEWIQKRVGITKRHIVGEHDTTVSMAITAAQAALAQAQISADQIDLIIVATSTPTHIFPSTACFVQAALGIADCVAFDVNAACSGFIYALGIADPMFRAGSTENALIIGVDALSKTINWTDRRTCVLFGDGAGAVVLQASQVPGMLTTQLHAAGQYSELLYIRDQLWYPDQDCFLTMSGKEVFKLAVTKLDEIVDEILKKAGLKKQDVDWLIPHQANFRIIQATAKKLNLSMEKVILTVKDHGNTSAASVPLALDFAVREGKVRPGDILLLEAFGAGFNWGAALVRY